MLAGLLLSCLGILIRCFAGCALVSFVVACDGLGDLFGREFLVIVGLQHVTARIRIGSHIGEPSFRDENSLCNLTLPEVRATADWNSALTAITPVGLSIRS